MGSSIKSIAEKIKNRQGTCYFNESPVQSQDSKLCGEFVVYFCIWRLFNWDLTLEELLNDIFSEDLLNNEREVKKFITNL